MILAGYPVTMCASRASFIPPASSVALAVAFAFAPVPVAGSDGVSGARSRPDSAERRCLAAKRRVERQRDIVADVDARIARDDKAKAACTGKRACDKQDRALNASQARKQHYEKQLARLDAEAKEACPNR